MRGVRLYVLSVVMVMLCSSLALSGITVFDPANYKQNLLTATRQLMAIEQRIKQLANQAQILLNMEKNLTSLGKSLAEPLKAKLDELQALLEKANGLTKSVAETEKTYATLFPERYTNALTMDKTVSQAKARWEHRLRAFKAALGIQAKVLETLKEDSIHLLTLMRQSEQAIGIKAAIQAGNEIMALNVKQLLQMQKLIIAQSRGALLDQAQQASAEAESRAYFKSFMGNWGR